MGCWRRFQSAADRNQQPITRLARRVRRERPLLFAASCGLAVAVLGYLSDSTIYGTDYTETRTILEGGSIPASFGALKLIATVISYASGIPGGIFSPSLAVGAGLGQNAALFPWPRW